MAACSLSAPGYRVIAEKSTKMNSSRDSHEYLVHRGRWLARFSRTIAILPTRMTLALALLASVGGTRIGPVRMIGNLLSGLAAPLPDPIDYSQLRGLPKSLGFEAGEYALKGEVPEKSKDGWTVATFAGGCFWGTELHFQRTEGVVATCVGCAQHAASHAAASASPCSALDVRSPADTQGRLEKPTYGEVCSGRSGHTEATMILYNPKKVSYSTLVDVLLRTIDPTLKDQVGNDYGTQYRHGIYVRRRRESPRRPAPRHSPHSVRSVHVAHRRTPRSNCKRRAPSSRASMPNCQRDG